MLANELVNHLLNQSTCYQREFPSSGPELGNGLISSHHVMNFFIA